MIMHARRITTFLAAAGLFSIASIALAKEKAGTPAKEKAGSGISEYTKGNQLFESKQYEQAVAEFTKAIEANGKQPAFYENRGFAYIALEKGQKQPPIFPRPLSWRRKMNALTSGELRFRSCKRIMIKRWPTLARRWSSSPLTPLLISSAAMLRLDSTSGTRRSRILQR